MLLRGGELDGERVLREDTVDAAFSIAQSVVIAGDRRLAALREVHRNDGDFLSRYRVLLSVGHDEYWSAPMRAMRLFAVLALGMLLHLHADAAPACADTDLRLNEFMAAPARDWDGSGV